VSTSFRGTAGWTVTHARSRRRTALPRAASARLAVVFFALLLGASCGGSQKSEAGSSAADGGAAAPGVSPAAVPATPSELAVGERLFDENCARCHGPRAVGTDHGPPLVHIIYEPHHHSDAAFQMAAANGVRAHHWSFGDMPPVPGVTPDQVTQIVAYVRWLQRQAGIE
jgi:mono/diheme cytochrome c family protein